jgi:hypothetical protein
MNSNPISKLVFHLAVFSSADMFLRPRTQLVNLAVVPVLAKPESSRAIYMTTSLETNVDSALDITSACKSL